MASNKPQVKFDYAVLCDEIRKEDNGKLIVIGVYTGDVLVPAFPISLGLSVLMHGFTNEKGHYPFEFRFRLKYAESEGTVIQAEGAVQSSKDGRHEVTLPTPRLPIDVANPASLSISYRQQGSRWRPILSKEIRLNPALTSEPQPLT